ncbi:hypothetical protein [Chryseobacterium indologenes]|uniref:hypothetical protein n=1 Tax=Chryseobacterium indologenes TaxID=253 RepID=UPI0021A60698|nr:hypothetical protein [Elizabethkingia anophelis]
MSLEITLIENGSTPNTEKIWLQAKGNINTKGYAIVDRTFDANGNISNEFRHIYILPSIDLKKDEDLIIYIGSGKNEKRKFSDTKKDYYACYWGSEHCILNDKGGDTITLIQYDVITSKKALAIKK